MVIVTSTHGTAGSYPPYVASISHALVRISFYHILYNQKAAAKGSAGGKRPLTGFMLFSKENRSKVKEENPDITFGGIGKKLGEMWRALSEKEKAAYKTDKA